jgi:uncharacterized protein YuzE
MKLTYDPRRNIAYIAFREKSAEVESVRVTEDLIVDVAPDGTVYGIELLNANEQLTGADDGRFIFVDPISGKEHSLKVA